MKNIFEIMKEYGLEVPEDKKKEFEKTVLENYKTMTDYDNQAKKLDAANETIKANDTAMKDLQDKLDGFRDVDVSGLNQRINDLDTDKANIQTDYDAKIADVETLKASKNQKEDIAAALKALTEAEDSKMLFGAPEPNPVGTGNLIGQVRTGGGSNADDAAMRAAMGLPPASETK